MKAVLSVLISVVLLSCTLMLSGCGASDYTSAYNNANMYYKSSDAFEEELNAFLKDLLEK